MRENLTFHFNPESGQGTLVSARDDGEMKLPPRKKACINKTNENVIENALFRLVPQRVQARVGSAETLAIYERRKSVGEITNTKSCVCFEGRINDCRASFVDITIAR